MALLTIVPYLAIIPLYIFYICIWIMMYAFLTLWIKSEVPSFMFFNVRHASTIKETWILTFFASPFKKNSVFIYHITSSCHLIMPYEWLDIQIYKVESCLLYEVILMNDAYAISTCFTCLFNFFICHVVHCINFYLHTVHVSVFIYE